MNWVISGAGFEENSPLADCNEKFDQSGSYSETDSDIADEISKTIRQVSMRVAETQDEFIFQTLRDFGLSTSNIVVEKEELVQAIQLIRMMKEYGIDIFERYNTATAQAGIFRRGYKEGLHDGIEKSVVKLWIFWRKENEMFNIYVIGSLSRDEKIKEIAEDYASFGHHVDYVKKQPETPFSKLVEDCFDKIEKADLVLVVPRDDGSIGKGTTYEIVFARRVGTDVIFLNI